jgi:hypothetical protein
LSICVVPGAGANHLYSERMAESKFDDTFQGLLLQLAPAVDYRLCNSRARLFRCQGI